MKPDAWTKASAIAEIISSVAIVATLVYLAAEMRQNTAALNAQSRQSLLASSQSELFVQLENADIIESMSKPGPLTAEENIRLDLLMTALLRAREFSWLQYESGVIDEAQWSTELAVTKTLMSSPRSRLWWNKLGRTYFGAGFVDFLDSLIADQPLSEDVWMEMSRWATP